MEPTAVPRFFPKGTLNLIIELLDLKFLASVSFDINYTKNPMVTYSCAQFARCRHTQLPNCHGDTGMFVPP